MTAAHAYRLFRYASLAGALAGALALTAAPGAARAEREHVSFTYQKIIWSTETAKNASVWIRNGQPPASPPPGGALADLPQATNGRVPPHTPDFALHRGASPSGSGRDDGWSPPRFKLGVPDAAPRAANGLQMKYQMFKPDGQPVR